MNSWHGGPTNFASRTSRAQRSNAVSDGAVTAPPRSARRKRPSERGDRIAARLTPEAHRQLKTAVRSLGTTKSTLIRALIMQALRHEPIARAALEELDRPAYPQFTSEIRA